MALTDSQKISLTYKKLLGVVETSTAKDFFEEAIPTGFVVTPDMIWAQASQIPDTAPAITTSSQVFTETGETLTYGASGVLQYFSQVPLSPVSGSPKSFYHAALKDAIPATHDSNGSYAYILKNTANNTISFGVQDWILDPVAGVITFYGSSLSSIGVSSSQPPRISFYRYNGSKGLDASASFPLKDTTVLLANTALTSFAQLRVSGTAGTSQYTLPTIPNNGTTSTVVLVETLNSVLTSQGVIDGGEY